jgi:hypothetical protein
VHLSSIFNSSTYQARWRPSAWLVYFLAAVILAESALRIPLVSERLPAPEPTLWHSELIQTKLDYLKTLESERGIDILFIGNSAMQAGLDPRVFDAARGKVDGAGPGAFNAALEGMPPYGTLMFLEIYLRYTHPQLIIYGITPQDLNSNSPWARDITDRVKHSPLALAESRRGLRGRLIANLLDFSYLYRYRIVLHRMLLSGGMAGDDPYVYFDERGYQSLPRRLSDVPPGKRGAYFNRAGVLNYSAQGVQPESLKDLITYAAREDIKLILVNMPLADDYYSNFDSPEDYQAYYSAIAQIAAENQIPLWDLEGLSGADGFSDEHFADFNHLNRAGAQKLSKLLSERYVESVQKGPQMLLIDVSKTRSANSISLPHQSEATHEKNFTRKEE